MITHTTPRRKVPIEMAFACLADVIEVLSPHCERMEIVGSIRRGCLDVTDLDLCVIPCRIFNSDGNLVPVDGFSAAVNGYKYVRGKPEGRWARRIVDADEPLGFINLDLFICFPENFGLVHAFRTGDDWFCVEVLRKGWHDAGYSTKAGILFDRDGKMVKVREERELFELIKVDWIEPSERTEGHWNKRKKRNQWNGFTI